MRARILVTVLAVVVGSAASAHAGLINGGFETGDLSGWTTFTTANGTLGGAGEVVLFDTNGDGIATNSARFRVGEATLSNLLEGGGIFQGVALGTGALTISADIAVAWAPIDNHDGGLFELLFDGRVVDSHDFGLVRAGSVTRASLAASFDVGAGHHEVRLRMTRPWLAEPLTPFQLVDNVILDGPEPPVEPVPEPGTLLLLGGGLLGLAVRRRRSP